MKRTILGIVYDTKVDEEIINYDGDEMETQCLCRTAQGHFYLEVTKLQRWQDRAWISCSFDREEGDEPPIRRFELIRPLTHEQALNWFIETQVPECFQSVFSERVSSLPLQTPMRLSPETRVEIMGLRMKIKTLNKVLAAASDKDRIALFKKAILVAQP